MSDHQLFANRPRIAQNLPLQDYLARIGTRFSRAYTVLPICSPARASMQTGQYPHRHGLTENDGRFGGRSGLVPGEGLLIETLQQADYRCGWFGKWHLSNTQTAQDFGCQGMSWPGYGYPYNSPAYAEYLARQGLPDPVVRIETRGECGTQPGAQIALRDLSDWHDFEAGSAVFQGPATQHEAFFLADAAIRWIDAQADQPFFCQVNCWGPHPPYHCGPDSPDLGAALSPNIDHDLSGRPEHHKSYRDGWAQTLGPSDCDAQHLTRRALQQAHLCETALLQVVKSVLNGPHADNTIIVFCADHGDAVGSHGGMLNKGGLMVEEVLRIPLLMAGPGIARQHRGDLVSCIDLAPTLSRAAGQGMRGMDGADLTTLLSGGVAPDRSGILSQHYGLHVPLMQRCWHAEGWKMVLQQDGFCELYDLQNDPAEMCNLAHDARAAPVRARMERQLQHEMTTARDPAVSAFAMSH